MHLRMRVLLLQPTLENAIACTTASRLVQELLSRRWRDIVDTPLPFPPAVGIDVGKKSVGIEDIFGEEG